TFHNFFFFFQAEDGIRDGHVTGVQTCALPISSCWLPRPPAGRRTKPTTAPSRADLLAQQELRQLPPHDARVPGGHQRDGRGAVEIGRASCRERVEISGGGGWIEKKNEVAGG